MIAEVLPNVPPRLPLSQFALRSQSEVYSILLGVGKGSFDSEQYSHLMHEPDGAGDTYTRVPFVREVIDE